MHSPECAWIVKEGYLRDAVIAYPNAAKYSAARAGMVRAARWQNLVELRRVYPSSGPVVVGFRVCSESAVIRGR